LLGISITLFGQSWLKIHLRGFSQTEQEDVFRLYARESAVDFCRSRQDHLRSGRTSLHFIGSCSHTRWLLYALVDGYGLRRGITPALILGTNAILAFIVSSIIATTFNRIHVSGLNLHAYLYQHFLAPWLPPTLGSHT
jgi:hypothetical protein